MTQILTHGASFLAGIALGVLAMAAITWWLVPRRRPGEADLVCYEAYQVVGSLLMDLGQFESDEAEKILDNLSEARLVHEDVLPWPSYKKGDRIEAMVATLRQVGLSKARSVILLARLEELPISEAKRLVHHSAAWADRKAADEAMHAASLGEVNKP